MGGAIIGAALGLMGDVAGASGARVWIVGAAAAIALVVSLTSDHFELGRPCQVPRRWSRSMPAFRRFLIWGAMLGSGVLTLIPYPAFFVLLAAEVTSPPLIAAVAGGLYGLVREAPALIPLASRGEPQELMDVLPRLKPSWRRLNLALAVLGGAALVLGAL